MGILIGAPTTQGIHLGHIPRNNPSSFTNKNMGNFPNFFTSEKGARLGHGSNRV